MSTTKVTKLKDRAHEACFHLTFISDGGSDETDAVKVDYSALEGGLYDEDDLAKLVIREIVWSVVGGSVFLQFADEAENFTILTLGPGSGFLDFNGQISAPIQNGAANPTGDIVISTKGMTANDGYTIILKVGAK